MDCLPMMIRSGFSFSTSALRALATASGSTPPRSVGASVCTRMPRSAPIAMAVRRVSCALSGPIVTATISRFSGFFQPGGFFDGDFVEGVHRHFDIAQLDAAFVRLHTDFTL